MELIRLFLSTSWKSITLAMLTGLLSGASSAGLIALINMTIRGTNLADGILTLGFLGQSITDASREWYRQQFSVVFSDFYLFDRLLGLDDFDRDRQTQDYLEQLHLEHKVKINNGAFSTTALSQGQRKRLALLTAYLEDRAIYVFDEWASDQDPAFKKIFYMQLLPELRSRGKAIVVVSHDDRYFDQADRIVKLDYGKVEYDKQVHSQ